MFPGSCGGRCRARVWAAGEQLHAPRRPRSSALAPGRPPGTARTTTAGRATRQTDTVTSPRSRALAPHPRALAPPGPACPRQMAAPGRSSAQGYFHSELLIFRRALFVEPSETRGQELSFWGFFWRWFTCAAGAWRDRSQHHEHDPAVPAHLSWPLRPSPAHPPAEAHFWASWVVLGAPVMGLGDASQPHHVREDRTRGSSTPTFPLGNTKPPASGHQLSRHWAAWALQPHVFHGLTRLSCHPSPVTSVRGLTQEALEKAAV